MSCRSGTGFELRLESRAVETIRRRYHGFTMPLAITCHHLPSLAITCDHFESTWLRPLGSMALDQTSHRDSHARIKSAEFGLARADESFSNNSHTSPHLRGATCVSDSLGCSMLFISLLVLIFFFFLDHVCMSVCMLLSIQTFAISTCLSFFRSVPFLPSMCPSDVFPALYAPFDLLVCVLFLVVCVSVNFASSTCLVFASASFLAACLPSRPPCIHSFYPSYISSSPQLQIRLFVDPCLLLHWF